MPNSRLVGRDFVEQLWMHLTGKHIPAVRDHRRQEFQGVRASVYNNQATRADTALQTPVVRAISANHG